MMKQPAVSQWMKRSKVEKRRIEAPERPASIMMRPRTR
jgi:hypothetical protein